MEDVGPTPFYEGIIINGKHETFFLIIHINVLIMLESGIMFNDSLFYLRFKIIKYNVGKVKHGIGSVTSVCH